MHLRRLAGTVWYIQTYIAYIHLHFTRIYVDIYVYIHEATEICQHTRLYTYIHAHTYVHKYTYHLYIYKYTYLQHYPLPSSVFRQGVWKFIYSGHIYI